MASIFFEILTMRPLKREQGQDDPFDIWHKEAPAFLPNFYDFHEPIRKIFYSANIDDAARKWYENTLAPGILLQRRPKPRMSAILFRGFPAFGGHWTWEIHLSEHWAYDPTAFKSLLVASSCRFDADFGFIHTPTIRDFANGLCNKVARPGSSRNKSPYMFVTSLNLHRSIPDVYWTTVFGSPYVEIFTRERLLSAPAYHVQELANGAVLLQLTERIGDIATNPIAFEDVRQAVRTHLGEDAFFSTERETARVPNFRVAPAD